MKLEQIQLFDDERIVPHGAQRTTWFVRQGEAWIKAAEWPGATTERRDSGPGTVWERAVTVTLPLGAELMRVETKPLPPANKDPMSYLRTETKRQPRATRRTYYRVGPGGRLTQLGRSDPT